LPDVPGAEHVEIGCATHRRDLEQRAQSGETLTQTLGGRHRIVASLPADFVLYDAAPDGRVLLGRGLDDRILGSFPTEPRERNLSYFDHSSAVGLTASGDSLLFVDAAQGGGGSTYVRGTDGSAKRLGEVPRAMAISPDGGLALGAGVDGTLVVVPTGAGPTRSPAGRQRRLALAGAISRGILSGRQARLLGGP
jgi:hypothetical protein